MPRKRQGRAASIGCVAINEIPAVAPAALRFNLRPKLRLKPGPPGEAIRCPFRIMLTCKGPSNRPFSGHKVMQMPRFRPRFWQEKPKSQKNPRKLADPPRGSTQHAFAAAPSQRGTRQNAL